MTAQTQSCKVSENIALKVKGIEKYMNSRKHVISKLRADKEILLNEIELEEFKIGIAMIRDKRRAELTKEEFNDLVEKFNARTTVA